MVPQRSMDALSERSLNTNTSSSSSGSTRRRRRRGLARHNSSGSSSSSGGLRTNHHHQIPETIQEGRDSRLRASLDAGMAALRRWIRSRNSHLATTTTTTPSSSPRRSFRQGSSSSNSMLSWQPPRDGGGGGGNGNAQIFSSLSMHLGEMDIRDDSFLPPPIPNRRRQRERTLSEPEASGLRNYIFQRATRGTLSMTSSSAERGHYPHSFTHHTTTTTTTRQLPTMCRRWNNNNRRRAPITTTTTTIPTVRHKRHQPSVSVDHYRCGSLVFVVALCHFGVLGSPDECLPGVD